MKRREKEEKVKNNEIDDLSEIGKDYLFDRPAEMVFVRKHMFS
jgi:hypothetical protein